MNCAYLKVVGTTKAFTAPKMFVANVGQCTTSEGVEFVFPNRGSNVQYGGSYAGMTNVAATTDCVAGNNVDVTVAGTGNGSGGQSNLSTSNTVTTGTRTTLSTSSSPSTTATTSSSRAATTTGTSGCTQGSIQCSSDGTTWSVCVNSAYVNLGAVSPGTKCVNGAIVCLSNTTIRTTTTPTTSTKPPVTTSPTVTTIKPGLTTSTRNTNVATTTTGGSSGCTSGQIKCAADGKSWSMCSNNAYIFMGAVAPGYTFEIMADNRNNLCQWKNTKKIDKLDWIEYIAMVDFG